MFEIPPGPERDAAMAWMRRLMQDMHQQLSGIPPFPVFGLDAPRLTPAVLGATHGAGADLRMISLTYGEYSAAQGPFVTVRSDRLGNDRGARLPDLEWLLAADRDRADDPAENGEPDPEWVDVRPAVLVVGGVRLPAQMRTEDGRGPPRSSRSCAGSPRSGWRWSPAAFLSTRCGWAGLVTSGRIRPGGKG